MEEKEKKPRLVQFVIDDCRSCPYHSPAFNRECSHPQNGLLLTENFHPSRTIEGDDLTAVFPSWCPLTELSILGLTPYPPFAKVQAKKGN